jgi:hypothetical protein
MDSVNSIFETMRIYNTLKAEHTTPASRKPRDGRTAVDVEVEKALTYLLPPGSVDIAEVLLAVHENVEALMRDLRRAGQLRGANQTHLRGAISTAWLDGLGVGLHHPR